MSTAQKINDYANKVLAKTETSKPTTDYSTLATAGKAKPTRESSFAQFVQGDIKGGAYAAAYRIATVNLAIEQSLKGNYSPMHEAIKLCEGKVKKSQAYHAGFAAMGDIVKVDYIGRLDATENKAAREKIANRLHHLTIAFAVAFNDVMAKKVEKKARVAPVAVVAPVAEAVAIVALDSLESEDLTEKQVLSEIVVEMEMERDAAVQSVLSLIRTGMLSIEELEAIGEALGNYAFASQLNNTQPETMVAH